MDFTFSSEQDEAAALAAQIFGDLTTVERQRAVESGGDRFDADLWRAVADAGLISLPIAEEYGGAGLGLIEACRVLVEAGRTVAPIPLAPVYAATAAIGAYGSDNQRSRWLPGIADGTSIIVPALAEDLDAQPVHPTTVATSGPDGWSLTGTKTVVRAGTRAAAYLVTASTTDGSAVFVVQAGATGVSVEAQRTTDGDVAGLVTLTGASAEILGAADAARVLAELVTIAASAEMVGIAEGSLALTTAYAKEREQFERPIATFQSVAHRLADGHIDLLFGSLTLWQAVWRLSEGLDSALEVAEAALWAADISHRIAHSTVHIHGGVGIDLDGAAHRYYTAAKRFEFTAGGTTASALAVGRLLAAEPA
ncbi:acyl-CoA dehydrogenase [Nocardioides baekrokdamisoli]|uniref:Acyl-CoA dehydrogenase n=1 Tax=Nocardioides baekrokdamisoli TaxID=1804624 RepID=A0A3G9IK08_9ACTN|nr:acyl-CoA dehydrogenase family protein [Nocardioides baekrokdamisoli]BBH18502.1 acyl-CoA dehydrogenase [Nocardioides baekrokdamisoli]